MTVNQLVAITGIVIAVILWIFFGTDLAASFAIGWIAAEAIWPSDRK